MAPNRRSPGRKSRLDRAPVLGVDIGGVLVDRVAEGTDTSFFGQDPMSTPAVIGAVESLTELAARVFDYRIHLVSKAGPRVEAVTRAWLQHTGFFSATRLGEHQLHFVRERRDKAAICTRLGVTHFVDDRMSVLNHLASVPHRYLFTGGLGSRPVPDAITIPLSMTVVSDWLSLSQQLVESLR